MTLSYEELEFPNYINSSVPVELNSLKGKKIKLNVADAVKAAILSGLNLLLVSDTGLGKTQLMYDVVRHYFGGNVSEGGKANECIARKNFDADELFLEWSKEQQKYLINEKRIAALVNRVDELNRAPSIVQNDIFDLAEGSRSIRGEDRILGQEGYKLFLTGINLNRINGDFEGISNIDRALLSRAKINIDLDYYGITDKDESKILLSGKPGIKLAPLRDISDKVLSAFHEIELRSKQPSPYIDAYLRVLSSGLRYCSADELKRKRRNWPTECGSCSKKSEKAVCSELKPAEPRTLLTIKNFANGLDYLIELKEGSDTEIDPLDLVYEAAKFTAYHGFLNMQELLDKYKGDDQHMMNELLKEIKTKVQEIRPYLDESIKHALRGEVKTEYIKYKLNEKSIVCVYTPQLVKELKDKKVNFTKFNPAEKLADLGLGHDWVQPYLESLAENAHK